MGTGQLTLDESYFTFFKELSKVRMQGKIKAHKLLFVFSRSPTHCLRAIRLPHRHRSQQGGGMEAQSSTSGQFCLRGHIAGLLSVRCSHCPD